MKSSVVSLSLGKPKSVADYIPYKGLFTPQMAPTTRAYCLVFSFFLGILLITTGSVFYHLTASRPMSGGHLIHTPPIPLALTLIIGGIAIVLSCFGIIWKYGFDDGDDSLDDDSSNFVKDDELEQNRYCPTHHSNCHPA